MNAKIDYDILQYASEHDGFTQRELAETLGCALGSVNQGLKRLWEQELLFKDGRLTEQAKELLAGHSVKRAVILAAGSGMRMLPINREQSKGMLQVKGETLVERLIRQLHEADIYEIYVIVGFMKEQYEYLIDKYQVELLVNPEYDGKNNLHSLVKAADHLQQAYIVPCDIWCERNPFHKSELYSWYLVQTERTTRSDVTMNRKGELVRVDAASEGNGDSHL